MRESGSYSPNINYITNTTLLTREDLFEHSERLAIGYGMMKTPPYTTLLVGKNLRVS